MLILLILLENANFWYPAHRELLLGVRRVRLLRPGGLRHAELEEGRVVVEAPVVVQRLDLSEVVNVPFLVVAAVAWVHESLYSF